MRVAVLGGGIAGLTAAYRLSRQGARVVLYEASDRLGGLATWFDYKEMRLDRYYHVILDSDSYLLELLDELELTADLRWAETRMGFFVRGRLFPFNSAMDLLCFRALRLIDRVRTGLAALYITKVVKDGRPLDDVLAHVWLKKLFGPRVYRAIWEPLLTAKFGTLREHVPAYWVWNTLTREKDGSQEVKAYVKGGYARIADRLHEAIEQQGGQLRLNSPVRGLDWNGSSAILGFDGSEEEFDAVVSTLPLPLLHQISGPALAPRVPLPSLAFQGVVNVLLVCNRPLDRYYWTAVVDSGLPFQGVVETTHVIDPAWIGGRHLIYLMNYSSPGDEPYERDDTTAVRQAMDGLQRLYPSFTPHCVEASFVFRAPHVEPVWPTGYLSKRPGTRIGDTQIYLATTAQAYPMVTSWNTSVKLATDAVRAMPQAAASTRSIALVSAS